MASLCRVDGDEKRSPRQVVAAGHKSEATLFLANQVVFHLMENRGLPNAKYRKSAGKWVKK